MSAPHHITLWPRIMKWRAGLSDAIRRHWRNALILLSMLLALWPLLIRMLLEISQQEWLEQIQKLLEILLAQ